MHCELPNVERLCLRWTIGDVRPRGFEMLRLSIACAARLFGTDARYVVCLNSLASDEAKLRTGWVPVEVEWRQVSLFDVPPTLREHFDDAMLEGTGWKLAPACIDENRFELALDNDCMLWGLPAGMRKWLESGQGGVIAEDVSRCLGCFDALTPPGAYNSGIRGTAPGCDWEAALIATLAASGADEPIRLSTELDEQGLQTATMFRSGTVHLVRAGEVSICSPFWPRCPELGVCGAHFVGMNARHTPWNYYGRPADLWLDEHWARHRPQLYARAGLAMPEADAADNSQIVDAIESAA